MVENTILDNYYHVFYVVVDLSSAAFSGNLTATWQFIITANTVLALDAIFHARTIMNRSVWESRTTEISCRCRTEYALCSSSHLCHLQSFGASKKNPKTLTRSVIKCRYLPI